jgi:hypothetical protein
MDYNKPISAKISGICGRYFPDDCLDEHRTISAKISGICGRLLLPADYADARRFQKGLAELKELM